MNNYIVSARKYRPTTFNDVIGQETLTTTLKNAIEQGKLAHAYLFCGPRGVGKTTCARIFAKTINCLSPKADGEACNACESCTAFNEQRSYNINELDAASNNSVDDIRGLIEQVQIPPQIGRYKVFIIDEVHMLSTAAFNAFLKTLEEPPAHAIFILATTEKHKILPTILSRCQIYDFARITVNDTVKHLQHVAEREGYTVEPEALHVIAEKADGGMRDALSIFDQVASYSSGHITYAKVIEDLNLLDADEYFAMTDTILKCDIKQIMLRLNNVLSKGFEGNYFMSGMASHFRNLLMARDEQTVQLLDVSERMRQQYHEQAMRCEPKVIYQALRLCNDCDLNYRTSNNKRLLVELTLIEIAQTASGDDDSACGRRPIRRLKSIFAKLVNASASPTSAPTAQPKVQPAAAAATTPTPNTTPAAAASTTSSEGKPVHAIPDFILNATKKEKVRPLAPTISIRSIMEDINNPNRKREEAPKEEAPAATTSATENTHAAKLNTPFNEDRFTYYWFRYANEMPKEQTATATRMKNMKFELLENAVVKVKVDNEMVEQYMHAVQIPLTNFLRMNLRNDYITLQFEVDDTVNAYRALSRVERFKALLDRHVAVRMLQSELGLDLA